MPLETNTQLWSILILNLPRECSCTDVHSASLVGFITNLDANLSVYHFRQIAGNGCCHCTQTHLWSILILIPSRKCLSTHVRSTFLVGFITNLDANLSVYNFQHKAGSGY